MKPLVRVISDTEVEYRWPIKCLPHQSLSNSSSDYLMIKTLTWTIWAKEAYERTLLSTTFGLFSE